MTFKGEPAKRGLPLAAVRMVASPSPDSFTRSSAIFSDDSEAVRLWNADVEALAGCLARGSSVDSAPTVARRLCTQLASTDAVSS